MSLSSAEVNFEDCQVALGNAIRLTREHRGLTQAELAERIGVDVGFIARIESGKEKPQLHTIVEVTIEGLGVRFGEVGHLVDQYLKRT